MTDKLRLNEIWVSINPGSITFLNQNFEKITYPLVKFLVTSILNKEKYEIGTFDDGRQKGATLTYDEPHSQKHLEIRLKKNSTYELLLFVYDAEDKEFIYKNKLSKDEEDLIPKELCELMKKVKELDRPVSFYNP